MPDCRIDLQVRVAPCFAFSEGDLPKLVVHPSFFKHPEAAKGPRLFRPVQCEQDNTQAQVSAQAAVRFFQHLLEPAERHGAVFGEQDADREPDTVIK